MRFNSFLLQEIAKQLFWFIFAMLLFLFNIVWWLVFFLHFWSLYFFNKSIHCFLQYISISSMIFFFQNRILKSPALLYLMYTSCLYSLILQVSLTNGDIQDGIAISWQMWVPIAHIQLCCCASLHCCSFPETFLFCDLASTPARSGFPSDSRPLPCWFDTFFTCIL